MTNMTQDPISGTFNITGNQNTFTITECCCDGSGSGSCCMNWTAITANTTLAACHGYIVESGALSLALPATSSVGDVIAVTLAQGTSWTITQAAGQQIRLGTYQTTVGASGSLMSTALGDSVSLVCTVANTSWMSYATQGNILIT